MNIGERIKLFRKKANLTQKELGEKINVTGTTITRYEKNLRTPDIETLKKIAKALNISLNTLLASFINSTYELISDILKYFSNEVSNNDIADPFFTEWSIKDEDYFKVFFGFARPQNNEFTENNLTNMLEIIIINDIEKFIQLFSIYNELILSFSKANLKSIDNYLQDFNLSLSNLNDNINTNINLNNSKLELHSNQQNIDYTAALSSFKNILNYVKTSSNQKSLRLLTYDLNFEKKLFDEIFYYLEEKLLIDSINKGKLTVKINSIEGDNNGNKEV